MSMELQIKLALIEIFADEEHKDKSTLEAAKEAFDWVAESLETTRETSVSHLKPVN